MCIRDSPSLYGVSIANNTLSIGHRLTIPTNGKIVVTGVVVANSLLSAGFSMTHDSVNKILTITSTASLSPAFRSLVFDSLVQDPSVPLEVYTTNEDQDEIYEIMA